ncbi:MAG: hypothetical protein LBT74_09880 [Acidobacteriota bacterium]|jgi:hypothetical protein|nr:hypothetical protein [Acidobacteriota bacterium]
MATELAATADTFAEFGGAPAGHPLPAAPDNRRPTIATDITFRSVLRKGSWEAMRRYVETHREHVGAILEKRLGVDVSLAAAMPPEGRVYDESTSGGAVEGAFIQGCAALDAGDFAQAAEHFERSSAASTGMNRATAENHLAYALLLQGETLRARMTLSPLVSGRCPFPSAYWNLACGMAEEQREGRLAVLAAGIGKAPHMRLLHGAVVLGLRFGHASLAEWLLCLPLVEAQLLASSLAADATPPSARETALLRIGSYVYEGEPEVPDPLEHLLPPAAVKAFFQAMLRHQRHAEPVDFWFRCRRRIAFMRYDFWKIKADYYELFGRRNRAVNAFKTELYCRLSALTGKEQFRSNKLFLDATRTRVGIYLCRCMTPALQVQGRAIHRMAGRFADEYGISLIPPDLNLQKLYGPRRDGDVPSAATAGRGRGRTGRGDDDRPHRQTGRGRGVWHPSDALQQGEGVL